MKFCLDDGTTLVPVVAPTQPGSSPEATLHLPANSIEQPPARATQPSSPPPPTITSVGFQPVGSASSAPSYPRETRRSAAILWVVGAIIIGVAAIAVALILTLNRSENANANANIQVALASPTSTPTVTTSTPTETGASDTNRPSAATQPTMPRETSTPAKTQPEKPAGTPTYSPPAPPRAPISGGVLNGKAVYLAQPSYPAIARAAHASGTVTVRVLIDESGNVISASAVSGHPLLQSSAISAAKSSRFSPTKLSGQPVKVSGVIVYNFVAQ